MKWLNEPSTWSEADGVLSLTTLAKGDYWRTTHYAFIHDDGHFAFEEHAGEFCATVQFDADFKDNYDQAGLMIRLDDTEWVKAGIEFFGGKRHLSVVVTHDLSDWSVCPWNHAGPVWLRLIRKGDAVAIQASSDGKEWELVRLAYFPPRLAAMIGPMACSPDGEGMHARFTGFTVGPAIAFEA